MLDKFCRRIAGKMRCYIEMEAKKQELVEYGLRIITFEVLVIPIVFIVSFLLGIGMEVSVAFVVFGALRATTGGAHSRSREWCVLRYLMIIYGSVIISTHIYLNYQWFFVSFIILFVMILMFGPADTEAKPIKCIDKRKKLKKYSIILLIFIYSIALIIKDTNNDIYNIIVITSACVAALMSPIGYKLLGCRRGCVSKN